MTVPPGGEEAQEISSMYVNILWKGVKRWRQALLHRCPVAKHNVLCTYSKSA